jgi:hypothetical protein
MEIKTLKQHLKGLKLPRVISDPEPDFWEYAHEQMMTEEHQEESDKLTEAMLRDIGAL